MTRLPSCRNPFPAWGACGHFEEMATPAGRMEPALPRSGLVQRELSSPESLRDSCSLTAQGAPGAPKGGWGSQMTDLVPRPEGGPEGENPPSGGPGELVARLKALVLDTVSSERSRRAYGKALDDFLAFLGRRPFPRASLQEFRSHMEASGLAPASVNLRLAPLRKLATEAAENGWMDPTVAAGIARVRGVRRPGAPGGEVGDRGRGDGSPAGA